MSEISLTVELKRGTGTDDRDTIRATVDGETVDQARQRVEELKPELEAWAEELRAVQPDSGSTPLGEPTPDSQTSLAEDD